MSPEPEFEVQSSRAVAVALFALGAIMLIGALLWRPLRTPRNLLLFATAIGIAVWRALDRRVRLAISADGIRYADWGGAVVPWHEFSGYRWKTWRQNPYLELVPRRPTELLATFSPVGRLNCWAARLVRMPAFAIAVTPLGVTTGDLEAAVARHLPRAGPAATP